MAGKIATRNAYGKALAALGAKYPKLVVLDADLANATMSKFFAAEYPERFFDMDFMDIVCVPADMGKYVIENLGVEPIRIHKTMLRDGFQNDPR